MNELVNFVRTTLNHKPGSLPRILIIFGIILVRLFDLFFFISRKKINSNSCKKYKARFFLMSDQLAYTLLSSITFNDIESIIIYG